MIPKLSAFLFWTLLSAGLCQENLDDIINSVFGGPPADNSTNVTTEDNRLGNLDLSPTVDMNAGSLASNSCVCVPFYQCKNGMLNKDGQGIINIRQKDPACTSYLEVCCNKTNGPNEQTGQIGQTGQTGQTGQIGQTGQTGPAGLPLQAGETGQTGQNGQSDETGDRNTVTQKGKPKGCGYRNPLGVGFRITGDTESEAQFGEFPWMVAILREEFSKGGQQKINVYQCGGALIHPQVVITASHCVIDKPTKLKIRAGEWDTQTTKEILPYQDREVLKVITHPKYYGGALFNDIAVLILQTPVDIAENVNVLCLPQQGFTYDNIRCYASGWGKDIFGKQGKYQVILKKVDLPIVRRDVCQDALRQTRLGKYFELHESFICAGGELGKDTCKGDGGSPLVCPIPGQPDRFYHAGIVAWGIGCGDESVPGVYANVALFRNWIDEQLYSNNIDVSMYKVY